MGTEVRFERMCPEYEDIWESGAWLVVFGRGSLGIDGPRLRVLGIFKGLPVPQAV